MNLKKYGFVLLLVCSLILPFKVNAKECTYKSAAGNTFKHTADSCPKQMWDCHGTLSSSSTDSTCVGAFLQSDGSENNNNGNNNSSSSNSSNANQNNNTYVYNESDWDLCKNLNSLKVFRFIGNILRVAFIVIPIILIVMGSIDFMKAVVANKDDDMKKAQMTFIKRCLAAIIVFLVPLITNLVLDVLDENKTNCLTCILNPDSCNITQ